MIHVQILQVHNFLLREQRFRMFKTVIFASHMFLNVHRLNSILYDQNWECFRIAVLESYTLLLNCKDFNQLMFRDPTPATYTIAKM